MSDEPRIYLPPCIYAGTRSETTDRAAWLRGILSYLYEQDPNAFTPPFREDSRAALMVLRWAANSGVDLDYTELAEEVARFTAEEYHTISCPSLIQIFGVCDRVTCARRVPWYLLRGRKVSYRAVAADILKEFRIVTIARTPYIYIDGVYVPGAEVLDQVIRDRLMGESDTGKVHGILDEIRSFTRISPNDFDADPDIINLQNGLYHISTNTLTPHTPDYLSRIQHPISYDPDATCPVATKFLSDIITRGADYIAFLEYVGYIFYRGKPFPHVLALVGSGANGKSKALEWVERVVGGANVCHIDLQSFGKDKFATSGLEGKCVDIMYDLSQTPLSESGPFKTITGDATISIEPKYSPRYDIVNHIKLLIATNIPPPVPDATPAFYRRWRIIICDSQFSSDEVDPFILDKVDTPQERSGFFNLCMTHLRGYLERGEPTGQLSIEETRKLYDGLSDPYQSFIDECVEEAEPSDARGFITEEDLYNAFDVFCKTNRLMPTGKYKFNRFIRNESALKVSSFRPKVGDRRPRAWKGIILRSEAI